MEEKVRFGPSGNDDSFYEQGLKDSCDAPAWLAHQGLTAYEYSFGRGYRMSSQTAEKLGKNAKENGILLSIHAPYYINFARRICLKAKNRLHAVNVPPAWELVGGRKFLSAF